MAASRYPTATYCRLFCTKYSKAGTDVLRASPGFAQADDSVPSPFSSSKIHVKPFITSCIITAVCVMYSVSPGMDRVYRINRTAPVFCRTSMPQTKYRNSMRNNDGRAAAGGGAVASTSVRLRSAAHDDVSPI